MVLINTKFDPLNTQQMSRSYHMRPLSYCLDKIVENGYPHELQIGKQDAWFVENGPRYQPEDLLIEKVFRFEGESDPADLSVLYAIKAKDQTRGYLVNAYGTYSSEDNPNYDAFVLKMPFAPSSRNMLEI
jgi:hypothetical protein